MSDLLIALPNGEKPGEKPRQQTLNQSKVHCPCSSAFNGHNERPAASRYCLFHTWMKMILSSSHFIDSILLSESVYTVHYRYDSMRVFFYDPWTFCLFFVSQGSPFAVFVLKLIPQHMHSIHIAPWRIAPSIHSHTWSPVSNVTIFFLDPFHVTIHKVLNGRRITDVSSIKR